MHFGAWHSQVSLHTGAIYSHNSQPCVSFASISETIRRDPVAIGPHLNPVLNYTKDDFPEIETVHYISGGPTAQHGCRSNPFLLSSRPYGIQEH